MSMFEGLKSTVNYMNFSIHNKDFAFAKAYSLFFLHHVKLC